MELVTESFGLANEIHMGDNMHLHSLRHHLQLEKSLHYPEKPTQEYKMANGALLRTLHPFLGKVMNILPPY